MFETLPEVLTLRLSQEILQIGRTTILGMIKRNELKAFKVRGRWRIKKEDLSRYVLQSSKKVIFWYLFLKGVKNKKIRTN